VATGQAAGVGTPLPGRRGRWGRRGADGADPAGGRPGRADPCRRL